MRIHRIFLNAAVGAAVFAANAVAQSHLELKVHTGHGVNGYDVNSTMISGEHDMIVIDPQFTLSEAHRLAAEILESKKNLTTIYVTHPHPDHLFGLAVLKQTFPNARAVALPATAEAAKTAWPARQKFWFPTYGNNIPGPDPVLTLEGEQFPITGPVQGDDGPGNSFVYIPSLKAVVTGTSCSITFTLECRAAKPVRTGARRSIRSRLLSPPSSCPDMKDRERPGICGRFSS